MVEKNINQNISLNSSFSQQSTNTFEPSCSMQVNSPDEKGSRTQVENSQINTQTNVTHWLETLEMAKKSIICYTEPYMADYVKTLSDSMVFLQFNEKMNICSDFNVTCIETDDYTQMVITNNCHISFNISDNTYCKNVVVSIETDISEVTQDESKQFIGEYLSGQKNVIKYSSEVYKGRAFGFIPFSIPRIQISDQTTSCVFENTSKWLYNMHSKVAAFSVPNYKGARIQVPSGLNIPEWHYLLKDYDLKVLGEYLQSGFPLNVDYDIFQFNTLADNHVSALQRPDGVNKYLAKFVKQQWWAP